MSWSFGLVRLVGMVGLVGLAGLIGLVGQPQRSNAKLSGRGYPGPIFQHPKSRATQSDTPIPGISSQQSQRSLSHGSRSRSHSRANLTKNSNLILLILNRANVLNRAHTERIGQRSWIWSWHIDSGNLWESGFELESGSISDSGNRAEIPNLTIVLLNRIGLICKNRAQLLNLTWTNTLHISVAKRPQVSDSKKTSLSDSMQKSGSKEHRNYLVSGSNTRLTTSDLVHTPANLTIGQSGARLSDSLTSAQTRKDFLK